MSATTKSTKPLNPKSADVKYTGGEPEWRLQPTADNRTSALISAFSWYNYHYDKKTVKELTIAWLVRNDRTRDAKDFARVPESGLRNQVGWLCRMNLMGLDLSEHELLWVDKMIAQHLAAVRAVKEVVKEAEDVVARRNIQDRLREKIIECSGELEGLFDEFMLSGAKMSADYKPIATIRGMNVAPQMTHMIADHWKKKLAEFELVVEGKDAALVEGYGQFSKIQLRNIIKFCEAVINDCGAYVQIKKVERKPRKVKPISPEKRASKFRVLAEFSELKLKGLPAASLVDRSEAWLYDVKKRKLIHVVADEYAKTFTVKNNNIIGFSTSETLQKTLRKPPETLKEITSVGKPAARKVFKDLNTTETAFNGRGTENLMILRVW